MKYFRIKYGYGKNEFFSVPETDVAKAMYAMTRGTIFSCSSGTVAGKSIIAITPDYHRFLGVNPDYELQGEDFRQIGNSKMREFEEIIALSSEKASAALPGGITRQLESQ
jgi:hypothetical protein